MTILLSLLLAAQPAAAAPPASAAPPPAPAPDWRPLADIGGRAIAWDAAGVERGDTLMISVRVTPPTPGSIVYADSITRVEMRCAPAEAHAVHTVNYHPDGTSGRTDDSPVPFVPIPPGSLFDPVHTALCPLAAPAPAAPPPPHP
jgi:hypothetical protein